MKDYLRSYQLSRGVGVATVVRSVACSAVVRTTRVLDDAGAGRRGWSTDRDAAQPFTAPEVIPATIWRLKKMNMMSGGMVMSRMSMKSRL